MWTSGSLDLTRPESLSELELKEILENRCIDFSCYKHLSKDELIDVYKRVALPLPQRDLDNIKDSSTKRHNDATNYPSSSDRRTYLNVTSATKTDINDFTGREKSSWDEVKSSWDEAKSPVTESKGTNKKVCLSSSQNAVKCNGIDKRGSDEKHCGAPSKKRQKITWP